MAFVLSDRVRETSTTTGTTDFALSATSDYRRFGDVMANIDTTWYAAVLGAAWEVGIGTWVTGNTLQRTTILASSNAGAKVSFGAGTKDVFMDIPASKVLPATTADLQALTASRLLTADQGIPRLLASGTVSAASVLWIPWASYTGFRAYRIILGGWLPATNGVAFDARFSTDGGSNANTTANYKFVFHEATSSGAGAYGGDAGTGVNEIKMGGDVGNASTHGLNGEITIIKPQSASLYSRIEFKHGWLDTSTRLRSTFGHGLLAVAQDTDAIVLFFSSGNIASGDWALYGIP